jgi:hypothetical protein
MGVVAEAEKPSLHFRTNSKFYLIGTTALYIALIAVTAPRHESWADEAQSWLLARDASLPELWNHLLHYEGTPGLWQTFLHVLIRLGVPFERLSLVSGSLGIAAAGILVRYSPFPLALRLSLPFTYFLCYQYAIVARSYSLLPVLLFLTAMIFLEAPRRLALFTALLILIAGVSVHGFVISIAIAIAAAVKQRFNLRSRQVLVAAVCYLAALGWFAYSAMPVPDGTFVSRGNPSLLHFFDVSANTFAQAITGEPWSSFALVALSLPFLWRGGSLLLFLLSSLFLCAVNAVIYSQVWHMGLLFLMWIFALWIAQEQSANRRPSEKILALVSVSIVTAILCFCTFLALQFDWSQPYSGSLAAARFIRASGIEGRSIYGIGYSCVAIQPYFKRNLFKNFQGGTGPAFWDWSTRNRSLKELDKLSQLNPDYILVGYTNYAEKILWSHDVRSAGYDAIAHFEGNLFWRAEILEPASYDIYRRRIRP